MTTLASTEAPVRPIPWQRLGWVAARRYRATLAATGAILGALAVYLLIDGRQMRSAYSTMSACAPADSATCHFVFQNFHQKYGQVGLVGVVLMFLPGLLGAFAGAPVLARELETGTVRYTWTQSVGRIRWAVAVLVPGALGVAALVGAFGALVSWRDQPLVDADQTSRLHATVFPVIGVAVAGWALLGFALGVFAGILWRRVLPALATAFAAWFGLAYLGAQLRLHYLPMLTSTSLEIPNRATTVDQWWTRSGIRVSDDAIDRTLQAINAQPNPGGESTGQAANVSVDPVEYLIHHGYAQVTGYQPDTRFWPFQWIEFGWLAALSILLLAATLVVVRRRSA